MHSDNILLILLINLTFIVLTIIVPEFDLGISLGKVMP